MRRLALAVGVALVLAPSIASADLAAQARFHYERARELYVAGRYESALEEFFAVQRIAPSPGTLYNIALCFERLRRDEETYLFYAEYLASDAEDPELREAATEALERLEARVARVRVVTDPPDASVFVDQRDRGRYGVTPMTVAVAPGTRTIVAARDGYRSATAQVEAVRGEQVMVRLELEQILGRLTVTGPDAGRLTVRDQAGAVVAEGPLGEALRLPPASYVLEVDAEGYLPWRSIRQVEADAEVVVVAEPSALPPATAAITVTANRSGALVRLDGVETGFAPLALPTVPPGEHALEVSQAGTRPWSGSVSVRPDERAWITVQLEPPASTERSPLTWVAGGFGILSLVAGAVFAGLAVDQRSQYDAEAAGSPEPGVLYEIESLGTAFSVAADTFFVVGGLGLGAAVLLYFVTETTHDEPSSATVDVEAR